MKQTKIPLLCETFMVAAAILTVGSHSTHTHTVLIKQPDEWALRDMISLPTDTDIYPEKNIHGVKDALISASACLRVRVSDNQLEIK